MLNLLALLACQNPVTPPPPPPDDVPPTGSSTTENVAAVRMPEGQAIVRQCYSQPVTETKRQYTSPPKASRGRPTPTTASAPPPPPSPVAAAPAAGPMGGADGGIGRIAASTGTTTGYGAGDAAANQAPGKGEGGAMPTEKTAPMAAAEPAPAPAAEAAPADMLADALAPDATSTQAGARRENEAAKKAKDDKAGFSREQAERMRAEANLDWGATVYLSNDDSMSLASAQRLLWAIQNKGPVQPSQVRPHELLNYFSFETNPVEKGEMFSVKGSAEQTGRDVLTLAFAVKGATPPRQPLDLTLVLDRSGSMSAEGRMEYLKRGLDTMTDQLVRGDRVDLVLFDDEVCTPLENYVVGRDDPSLLTDAISALAPRGSTDLDAGLKEGYRIANARTGADVEGRNRRMMLISDAQLNTGDINPDTVTEVAKAYESSGVRLTAIGVGRDFNDKVLDMLTEKGKGAYVYLGSEAVVDRVFGVGFPSLVQTIAHDVRFALDLPPSLAMKKFYGEESSTDPEDVQPIHYYAGTTQLFLQDLQLKDGRAVASDPITLTVEYKDAITGKASSQKFSTTVGALLESDPRNMRKARTLMAWTDMISARALGASPCDAPFTTWRERVSALGEDAEVQWLDGLTSPLCGAEPVTPRSLSSAGVAYKVKVDSDLPIAEVGLTCSGRTQKQSLSGSDTVARFATATPGGCTLTLMGNVPMQTQVEVPSTGGDIRCTVRGGRMSCG